jgi:Bifunctional DNA primase/polymerase, N-terminal
VNRAERETLARTLKAGAHAYARHGWLVFSLAPGGKDPLYASHGFKDATRVPDVIDAMWERNPLANIGVATVEATGLSVLDVDTDKDGYASLAALVERHGRLPAGPVVSTPTGGRHYYFRHRAGMSISAGQLGRGLDVRSSNGYVVMPPSTRPEGAYAWEVDPQTPLSAWPEWLVPPRREVRPLRPPADRPVDPDKTLAGLVGVVERALRGERNEKLFYSCCRLAEHVAAGRMSMDAGTAALLSAAASVGLSETESYATLRSALRTIGVAA